MPKDSKPTMTDEFRKVAGTWADLQAAYYGRRHPLSPADLYAAWMLVKAGLTNDVGEAAVKAFRLVESMPELADYRHGGTRVLTLREALDIAARYPDPTRDQRSFEEILSAFAVQYGPGAFETTGNWAIREAFYRELWAARPHLSGLEPEWAAAIAVSSSAYQLTESTDLDYLAAVAREFIRQQPDPWGWITESPRVWLRLSMIVPSTWRGRNVIYIWTLRYVPVVSRVLSYTDLGDSWVRRAGQRERLAYGTALNVCPALVKDGTLWAQEAARRLEAEQQREGAE